MRLLFGTLFGLAVAAIVGLGLTYFALTRGAAFGGLSIESWTAWPKTGTVDADPYARASIARNGRLPTALGDGVSFTVAVRRQWEELSTGVATLSSRASRRPRAFGH